jgi:hypothetical protein
VGGERDREVERRKKERGEKERRREERDVIFYIYCFENIYFAVKAKAGCFLEGFNPHPLARGQIFAE